MKAGMQHLVCGFCGNIFVINHSNNVDFVTKIIHLRSE